MSRILTRHRLRASTVLLVAALVFLVTGAAGCGGSHHSSGQQVDSKNRQDNYNRLVNLDPAHSMDTSPTRKTINRWVDTWGKDPNKLAYVYLQNSTGQLLGYYVFKGLPVSYCTSLTPNYQILQDKNDNGQMSVPAPSVDGVYYSGGECSTYYGFDATTGAYVEYTAGLGINVLLYDRPLGNRPNVPNLAPGH